MPRRVLAALTLALCVLLGLGGQALAFGDCNSAAYMATFDGRLHAGACDVLDTTQIRWGVRSVDMRLIKMHSAAMGAAEQADVAHKAHALADAVGAAMSHIGNVDIAPVTVLFTDLGPPHGEDAHADIPHTPGLAQECAITFYKSREGLTLDQFVFTYAHELFHCIQFKTWLNQMGAADSSWWSEGTAEYFAYLAVPSHSGDDGYITDFDTLSQTRSLLQMTYENAAFFAWLAQASPAAIHTFIDRMPAGGGSQLAALQNAVPPEQWVAFEEAYLDREIVLPGGRPLPSNPSPGGTLTISGTRSLALQAQPYVVERVSLVFQRGHNYELVFQDQPGDARIRWKESDAGAWQEPPAAVPACDIEMRKRMMWGTTSSETAGHMVVKVREGAADTCSCVPGSWNLSSASLQTNVQAISPRENRCTFEGGTLQITFNQDADSGGRATGIYAINGVTWTCVHPDSGTTRTVVTGTDGINWASVQSVLFLGFQNVAHAVGTVHTESRGRDGSTSSHDAPLVPAYSALGPFLGGRFRCAGNLLHIDPPPGHPPDPNYAFDLTRIGAPPEPRH